MKQSLLAGLLLIVIGLVLMLFPKFIWKISESWKNKNSKGPTDIYLIVIRVVGALSVFVGIFVALS